MNTFNNDICNIFTIKPLFINYDNDVIYSKKILKEIEYYILLKEKGLLIDSDKILQELNDKYDRFVFKLNMEYTKLNGTDIELGFCGTTRVENNNVNNYQNNIIDSKKIYYKKCVIDYIISLKN
jgi:hypothetical protein